MDCSICAERIGSKNLYNDCIIECLEKIKIHYISFESQLNRRNAIIENLKSKNIDLLAKINRLSSELKAANVNYVEKRRKTNSFEGDDEINISVSGNERLTTSFLLSEKSGDDLNKALNIDSEFDETFFGPSQTVNPDQEHSTFNKVPEKSTQVDRSDTILPRRAKESNKKNKNDENKSPVKVSKWNSKDTIQARKLSILTQNWNLSFIQPAAKKEDVNEKSLDEVAKSEEISNASSTNLKDLKPAKSNLSLRTTTRFRQSTLKFNAKKENQQDADETFCEEVTPSPTCISLTADASNKTYRQRSLRKLNLKTSQNIIFGSSPKKPSSETEYEKYLKIKPEPLSTKKEITKNIVKSGSPAKVSRNSPAADISGVCQLEDSSILILSSQPDDVVFIEETDPGFDNINSVDLLNEMMKSGETSDMLTKIELERIQKIKDIQERKNYLNTPEKTKEHEVAQDVPFFDCDECKAYATFIGRNLTNEEVAKRMRNCTKHKKPVQLHETPDGFWDPCFPTTQDIREINQTALDTRFIDKEN